MNLSKRSRSDDPNTSVQVNKKKGSIFSTKQKAAVAWIDLIQIINQDINVIVGDNVGEDGGNVHNVGCNSMSAVLEPGKPFTVGRSNCEAEFVFSDPRVSKRHCQILFDGVSKKLYLLNGALLNLKFNVSSKGGDTNYYSNDCVVNEFRSRLNVNGNDSVDCKRISCCCECKYLCKDSLNGVFVNGVKINGGVVVELCVGDEVLLVCGNNDGICPLRKSRVGFVVRSVVFHEELVVPGFGGFRFERQSFVRPVLSGKVKNKRVFALRVSDLELLSSECDEVIGRAQSLLARCNHVVRSQNPVSCIRRCLSTYCPVDGLYFCKSREKRSLSFEQNCNVNSSRESALQENVAVLREQSCETSAKDVQSLGFGFVQSTNVVLTSDMEVEAKSKLVNSCPEGDKAVLSHSIDYKVPHCVLNKLDEGSSPVCEAVTQKKCPIEILPPPGKNFYLNRLESMYQESSVNDNVISLPELLHPVEGILRMFIATFTSDISWFLSYCDIPSHLPITLACHNTERCWSADPGKRSCVPDPDFPNLVVVYPPFPEATAFGKDLKNKGVGCHHPKLLVVQRDDHMRVIITSANLVAKQWNHVTNTIWWQDFPRRDIPDYAPLFDQLSKDLTSDFAAQLAGFMASLVTDVPSQAYWMVELTKYDFTGAVTYLVASVPGLHSHRSLPPTSLDCRLKCNGRFLGSVEAFVVGLSHHFHSRVDSNGLQLKKLAAYMSQYSVKGCGMSEVILRREKNVPQDANAISVFVSNPAEFPNGDYVQLGFLTRTVAKWVSPLLDIGFFRFHGHVYPQEALAAASGESNTRVQLILHVSQGPNVKDFPKTMAPEHVSAFCSLIASLRRCTGLWRLEEVLHRYNWPETLESDFIYGASSIGTSVGASFLAAFSAAAGKRSQQADDSQESDPEWCCWNAGHEMKHPSIRIIFPTIERVKHSHCGITPSKSVLSFSEKTWQKLKTVDILHDAIPHPSDRVGRPMHVKVARRSFKSKTEGSSFGWVYCGSHNMSAAAWGQQISAKSGGPSSGTEKGNSSSMRLRVCNYELGVIFVFPPPRADKIVSNNPKLDDIRFPFVVPAPKYGPRDRPATMRAMWEALSELAERVGGTADDLVGTEEMVEEDPGDEDVNELVNYVVQEPEEEKAYADVLWHHVDSSQSC